MTNDDIVNAVVVAGNQTFDRNACPWCRLTRDGDQRLGNLNVPTDNTTDFEDHDSRSAGRACLRETSWARSVQVGDFDDLPAAPPFAGRPPALGTRECFQFPPILSDRGTTEQTQQQPDTYSRRDKHFQGMEFEIHS